MKRAIVLLGTSLALVACGGSAPPPEVPTEEISEPAPRPRRSSLQMSQELGSLDEAEVNQAFARLSPKLMRCMEEGTRNNEYLGGHVRFFVRIDQAGKARWAYLADSGLGDRETERCMLDVVKGARWPLPIDGEGQAKSSFDFDASPDIRPPVSWGEARVASALPQLRTKAKDCAMGSGRYRLTAYINEEGSVLSAGVAPPDEKGEAAADCIVEAVKATRFDSPGSWPAKVSFELN